MMDSGLKSRITTGVVLAIVVLLAVLLLPAKLFAIFSLVALVSVGGWEWSRLVGCTNLFRDFYVAGLISVSLLAYFLEGLTWVFIVAGVLWWGVILVLLGMYEKGSYFYKNYPWILRLSGFLVVVPAWIALVTLHKHFPSLVVYLIFLVAAADSGAYFSGKKWGKNKLAPELSPGKTREGMMGGFVAAIIWAIICATYFGLSASNWFYFILLSAIVALLSVSGDLFESLIKREAGQKDSGTILPGHGGILDRVDGLLAALPLFTLGIFWGSIVV